MSEISKIDLIPKETFNTPTKWEDNKTPLNADYLGNNSNAIQQLQEYLNDTTIPKVNEIINTVNTIEEEGSGAAVKIITWGSAE